MSPVPVADSSLRLDPSQAVLLVVDVQESLAAAMDSQRLASCQRNILILIELCRRLRIPVVESQQLPEKLGPTVPAIAQALRAPEIELHRLEKDTFAASDHPDFPGLYRRLGRRQWILVGMESHVCVFQTARGLRALGADVQLPADAIISRSTDNHRIGLDLAARCGALPTATEAVAFDALVRAGTDDFRAISRLVR